MQKPVGHGDDDDGLIGNTPATARVFCAVSAAITAQAYPPNALIALTSASTPAPPDGSTPAMVRMFGIECVTAVLASGVGLT